MDTKVEYSLAEIEIIDRTWTDKFAKETGWVEFSLEDPVDDLELFFSRLSSTSILDVGCGWGRYVWRFLDHNLDYYGLDQSVEMLRVAQKKNPDTRFIQSSFRNIPFRNGYFDGLWSCCSLSGVPKKHLVEVLHEHKRVMKHGGIIMIVMPALNESNEGMHTDDNGRSLYQAYYFLEEFVGLVREAGFSILASGNRRDSGSFSVLAKKPI